jgi:hypothetical protein
MLSELKHFLSDENGAVTVDWVVLTAGIVGLSMIVFRLLASPTANIGGEISAKIATTEVGYTATQD